MKLVSRRWPVVIANPFTLTFCALLLVLYGPVGAQPSQKAAQIVGTLGAGGGLPTQAGGGTVSARDFMIWVMSRARTL
jgi:hypothetical protein